MPFGARVERGEGGGVKRRCRTARSGRSRRTIEAAEADEGQVLALTNRRAVVACRARLRCGTAPRRRAPSSFGGHGLAQRLCLVEQRPGHGRQRRRGAANAVALLALALAPVVESGRVSHIWRPGASSARNTVLCRIGGREPAAVARTPSNGPCGRSRCVWISNRSRSRGGPWPSVHHARRRHGSRRRRPRRA